MTNYFTSDLHLGHSRILELCNRPFPSVDEMNEAIVTNWNKLVTDKDKVIILGDLAMGSIRDTLEIVRTLKGKKLLVPGNHDRVHPCYPQKPDKGEEMRRLYEDAGLHILGNEVTYSIGSKLWKLCHFPTAGDHTTDDRYPEYRPTLEDGQWLIHGHVHDLWRVNGKQINVGVDVWDFTPVSEDTLDVIIDNRSLPWPRPKPIRTVFLNP